MRACTDILQRVRHTNALSAAPRHAVTSGSDVCVCVCVGFSELRAGRSKDAINDAIYDRGRKNAPVELGGLNFPTRLARLRSERTGADPLYLGK